MSVRINNAAMKELRAVAAGALLRFAHTFHANMTATWQKGPPRSKPGEYLRIDSDNARRNLTVVPDDPKQVARDLTVYVGYRKNAEYAPQWELRQDGQRRKGLSDKLADFVNSGVMSQQMGAARVQGTFRP